MSADLIVFTIEKPDCINVLGTPGRVLFLGAIFFGEESYFSTGFVILSDLLIPDPDDPVVVDSDVSSVILNSGPDSFCFSGLILPYKPFYVTNVKPFRNSTLQNILTIVMLKNVK